MKRRTVRIGTRRSRLARWQAEWVAHALRGRYPDLEVDVVPLRTLGDRDQSTSLANLGRQGVFTKEIEEALLDCRCDVAVHSLKDLPTRMPAGLTLGAVPERADPRDALLSQSGRTLSQLPSGCVVGTSSLRRRSQVLHLRPDLVVREIRGNVPTRLRSVGIVVEGGREPETGRVDATILAYAGLQRLGAESHVTEVLSTDQVLPAPGQGALGIEIRSDDAETSEILQVLDDRTTRLATTAERELLRALGGWCHIPVGALAVVEGTRIILKGVVGDLEGRRVVSRERSGEDPEALGRELADELHGDGADEILREIIGTRENQAADGGRDGGGAE